MVLLTMMARAEHKLLVIAFENKEDAFSRSSPLYVISPSFSEFQNSRLPESTAVKHERERGRERG